jgi:hypothetical protein
MAKKSSKISKKVDLKPILRIRVRCKEAHTDPWLRRLYVIWAAPVKPPDSGAKADTPKFALAQTDSRGYLSPIRTTLDPDPRGGAMPMVPGIKYLLYFVRWPSAEFPTNIIGDLEDYEAGKKKWGNPQEIAPVFKAAGKNKHGAPVQEGIIEVEEKSSAFIQRGSDFYDGWTLFRDMPGTGSNSSDNDIQCPPLKTQVRRLQYHLGAMRYPIGNQWHPYSPEPFTPTASRSRGKPERLYPNESVFDIVTWNCVLAFQRDARGGSAVELNPGLSRTATLNGIFNPLPFAEDWQGEIRESANYVSETVAAETRAFFDIPADSDTVVEETTANAIKSWLTNKLRKPGKILVAAGQYDSWMQEDALPQIEALNADLARLGVTIPAQFNNALRDVRMSVLKPGAGQIVNSIHKSGFAFDFAMDGFVGPRAEFPLYFVHDESETTKVRWIVYTPVKIAKTPEQFRPGSTKPRAKKDAYVEFVESINPWSYDPGDTKGGKRGDALKIDGSLFLNFTNVCGAAGLDRISAHGDWAGSGESLTFTLTDSSAFGHLLDALKTGLSFAVTSKHSQRQTNLPDCTVDGTKHDLDSLGDFTAYLSLWYSAAKRLGAAPNVDVTPGTKEDDKLIQWLRGKSFKGKKVHISVTGRWAGGEGASNVKIAKDTTADLELGPKTEFPKTPFTLGPITEPQINPGSTISMPKFGTPQGMEWWHYQYTAGFDGQDWKTILGWIGWTEEGLLGKPGGKPIHGHYGLGYLKGRHLDRTAK